MNNLEIKNQDGKLVIDSREVAEMIDVRHDNLILKIRNYIEVLTTSDLRTSDFFIEWSYEDAKRENRPCYLLTKKGCDMVANKMTGEKGILFTAKYVTKFEEMEQQIKQPVIPLSPMEILKLQLQAYEEHDKKITEINTKVESIENNSPLFTVECKELQALVRRIGTKALGGYKTPAYKNHSLRGRVYADIHHQLKREFGVDRYEAIKRCQLNKAREIVTEYKIPTVLMDQVIVLNNQIELKTEVL